MGDLVRIATARFPERLVEFPIEPKRQPNLQPLRRAHVPAIVAAAHRQMCTLQGAEPTREEGA